jgi:Na+/H+ antiporter NhaD/arsenite permease-like protein
MILPKYRAYVALGSGALFVLFGLLGYLDLNTILNGIDFNVLLMIAGTMGIVSLFIESKMPSLLADLIIERTPNVKWAIISLALFAGIISAFVDNVATVLMVAPVALTIAKKLKISPVPSIIAIAISANLQGAATLVGDTTSIMLSAQAGMDFLDFFWFKGKMGIFFVVELGAVIATLLLFWIFRKENEKVNMDERTVVTDYFPSYLLLAMIGILIIASFFPSLPDYKNGLICVVLMLVGLIREVIKNKSTKPLIKGLKEIDYFTLLLLFGLFLVIGGIQSAGVITAIGNLIRDISGGNLLVAYTIIVWLSVALSAVIDNIPYVMTMLPVVAGVASGFGVPPYVLYFGLLIGATLGGNITPIGASANITGLGILRKEGYDVSAGTFMKISVPFTLAAVATGYILTWLIWVVF